MSNADFGDSIGWWEAQQGAVVDHVEHGTPPGGFEINGMKSHILIFSLPSFRCGKESSNMQRRGVGDK